VVNHPFAGSQIALQARDYFDDELDEKHVAVLARLEKTPKLLCHPIHLLYSYCENNHEPIHAAEPTRITIFKVPGAPD